MAYNAAIPGPTDLLSQSQQEILENFTQLQNAFSENHVALAAAGQGKHTHVVMTEQGADPGTGANEVALYSKDVGGATHLFFQPESAATAIDLSAVVNAGSVPTGSGYIDLVNGLRLQWGIGSVPSGTSAGTANYPIAFSAAPYALAVSANGAGATTDGIVYATGSTNTTLSVSGFKRLGGSSSNQPVPANLSFNYLVIGPA